MRDLGTINSYYERLLNKYSHLNQENSPCHSIENVSIIVSKKRRKKRKKHNVFQHAQQPTIAFRLSRFSKYKKQGSITKPSSMPELNECTKPVPSQNRSSHGKYIKHNKYNQCPFQSKFIANVVSEHRFDNRFMNLFNYPSQTKWKIYRCQLSSVEDCCCCSCNSDAMFEVMKGLYDCYKAQNCDNCCCVLCNHKLQEERMLGELRKSIATTARDKVLDGKTAVEKDKILNEMVKLRQPLPAGKTASEKALIDKTRKELGLPPSPANAADKAKMRKAEAAGIITPLEGKTPAQKEEILIAQANLGLPLPEGRTASEKALIDKVRATIESRSVIQDKHEQAAKADLLQSLEGKTPAEKEKTLKGLHDLGIPLPEGRTPSENAIIAKVKAGPRALSPVLAPSEQMGRAKVEGLLTPLKDKTPEQKEKILKGLVMTGLPLPEGQSPSEKKLIDKIRADLGLPMEPKSKSIREKHEQAAKAGLLQPLEGKTPAEKEKILKGLHDLGIPLPEGRTPSENAIIAKVKAGPRALSPVLAPSEQMGKAKAEGLLTPLKGKTPEQKENILKGLVMTGLPLPEGQSLSEKKLIDKVRADLGLPMEPKSKSIREKHEQAAKAGLLQPLEGKTPAEKEKILKGLHDLGIPLPEGRTPSENAIIAKVKVGPRALSPVLAPSEQKGKAKAERLLTPLKGKTPEQKEKHLKALANLGIPLPEAQSSSERIIVDKVRADLGLPMEPKTKSIRDKHELAAKAGLLQPLEGKTPTEKEKILKGLHDFGIPLPEGRTPSEKALIAKVKASPRAPSIKVESLPTVTSGKIREAKAAGLFKPLAGKTLEQKEQILQDLVDNSLALPEGKTSSEKALINKIKKESGKPDRTPSEKLQKTKTASEKDLVKKIKAEVSLPMEQTPSEKKGEIGKREKKVGVSRAVGINAESFQNIIKPTKCNRGCGCDKKKIKFKHSYIKIRVTSPDISSLCDCPGECFPRVKSKAIIDNEGIKVTIGSAVVIDSKECINQVMFDEIVSNTDLRETQTNYHNNLDDTKIPKHKVSSELGLNNSNKMNYIFNASSSDMSNSTRSYRIQSENIQTPRSIAQYQGRASTSDRIMESIRGLQSSDDVYKGPTSEPNSESSYETIVIVKNDMPFSTSTSNNMDSISLISVIDSSMSSSSAHYSGDQSTNDQLSINSLDGPTTSDDSIDHSAIVGEGNVIRNIRPAVPQQYTVLRMSQLEVNFGNKMMGNTKENPETEDPIVLFNQLPSKLDVSKIMFKIMSKKRFADASSIFIVVPMSDDDEEQGSSICVDSITSIPSNESHFTASTTSPVEPDSAQRTPSFTKHDEQFCGKGKKFYMEEISSSNDTHTMFQNKSLEVLRLIGMMKDEVCQISTRNEKEHKMLEKANSCIGTDTTSTDRACGSYKERYAANVISRQITPVFRKGNSYSWFRLPGMSSDVPPLCFDPSLIPKPPNRSRPRQHDRSQQNQIRKSPSLCSCPPDDLKEKKKRSAKVQKPSIASVRPEADTTPKKAGWFRSHKAASSVPVCDIPACSDRSSSPIPSKRRRPHISSRQHQTPEPPFPCVCLTDDDEETGNTSAVTKKAGWFRSHKAASSVPVCDTPACSDRSSSPMPSKQRRPHTSSRQHQTPEPPFSCVCSTDDDEETGNPSAVTKKAGWFRSHKAASSVPVCDTPACFDRSSSPIPSKQRRPHTSSRQHQTPEPPFPCVCSTDDDGETGNPSAVTKKAGWFRSHKAASSVPVCDTPACSDRSSSPMPSKRRRPHTSGQQHQTPEPPWPCVCSTDDDDETGNPSAVTKKAGNSFSWFRSRAPCFDPSLIPEPLNRQHVRSQQNQSAKSPSLCSCPPDDLIEKKKRSAKVQKPSIASVRPEATPKKAGKNSGRIRQPVECECYTPPWLDPSCSPVQPNRPRHHGRSQQNQITEPPSFCVCHPDDQTSSIESMRSEGDSAPKKAGKCFSWTRLYKRKEKRPPCFDLSSSPVPSNRPRQHGPSQQNQTPALPASCACSPIDFEDSRHPFAKVQKPSIESIRRPGTAPKKAGFRLSWSRLPCMRNKSVACDTPTCSVHRSTSPVPPNQPRHLGRSQQNQTTPSLCSCGPKDLEVTKNPSVKVQTPSKQSILHDGGTAPKKAGFRLSWSRLPCMRNKSVACDTPTCSVHRSSSPVPPNQPRHLGRSQQNQTTPSLCSCGPKDLEVTKNPSVKVQTPSIQSILHDGGTAPKKAGKCFSWSRLYKRKEKTLPCFDLSSSPVPSNRPRQQGRSQQIQTPASPSLCVCPSGDHEETRKTSGSSPPRLPSLPMRSAAKSNQQQQTTESSCICPPSDDEVTRYPSAKVGDTKTGSSWLRLPCLRKAAAWDIPLCFDRSSSPMPPHNTRHHGRGQQTGDLKETRNPSAKVQKPSIQSIRDEGRTAPKKAGVGSELFHLPYRLKAPARDSKIPKDLESPKDPDSPKTSKLKKSKIILCGCKEDEPMRSKYLESRKTSKQKEGTILCGCQEDKPMTPKKLESPKDPKSPETSKQKEGTNLCTCDEEILKLGPGFIRSSQEHNLMPQPEPIKKNVRLSHPIDQQPTKPAEEITPVPQTLASSKTGKEDKPMSPNVLESFNDLFGKSKICSCIKKSISKINEILKSQIGQQEPRSPKDLKSPETIHIKSKLNTIIKNSISKINEILKIQLGQQAPSEPKVQEISECGCNEDKPLSPKVLKCPETGHIKSKLNTNIKKFISKINETLKSQVDQQTPSEPKVPSSPKDVESPETSKHKEGESVCVCNEDKPMSSEDLKSPKELESQKTSNTKSKLNTNIQKSISKINETLKSQLDQQASREPKVPSSPKDLESPETSKQKEGESVCVCNEDKPMSSKDLKSPKEPESQKTSNTKSKLNTNIQKSISKINETLKSQLDQQASSEPKVPSSPKDLESPETSKQKEGESVCVCNEDKPMSSKDLKSPKEPESQKTSNTKSKLNTNIQKSISNINETLKSQLDQQASSEPKVPSSPKDLESPETSKQKEGESVCVCNEDKPMSSKDLKSPKELESQKTSNTKSKLNTNIQKSISKINETVKSQLDQQASSKPKVPSSPKDLKSPETIKQKAGESVCMCNEDKPMSHKDLKCPDTSHIKSKLNTIIKNSISKISEILKSQFGQQAPSEPKVPSSKSLKTGKQKDGKPAFERNDDKPMSPKELESPKTSKQKGEEILCGCEEDKTKGKVTCKCETEKQKENTEIKPGSEPIPRKQRCPPQLPPLMLGLPPVETPEGYLYEGIGPSCEWLDTGEIKKLRSQLTQSTSGFKACKRKKRENSKVPMGKDQDALSGDNIELDFGEAIRYFATMNPEYFQQLMQEELESQRQAEKNKVKEAKKLKRKMEKVRKKAEKEAKKGIVNKTTTTNEDYMPISYESTEFPDETEGTFPQGFKFSIVVKDDDPTGLAGVDCT